MSNYVHSGYFNLFRPPYANLARYRKSSIYCISSRMNEILVLIPLVPSFFHDVIQIAKDTPARSIYLVASDIGVLFISDYYQSWHHIRNNLRKECKIFSKYMPECHVPEAFTADVIRNLDNTLCLDIPRSRLDMSSIKVALSKAAVSTATPFACDVIVDDSISTKYFVVEMNCSKGKFLEGCMDAYDELHMPYIVGNYDGMTYNQFSKAFPKLVKKTWCYSFASEEEFEYARTRGVRIGGAYRNDFVQKQHHKW